MSSESSRGALDNPVVRWVHQNLLSSTTNILLTAVVIYVLFISVPGLIKWAFLDASLAGTTVVGCKVERDGLMVDAPGACWTFIKVRMPQFLFGLWYTQNPDQIWRPVLTFFIAAGAIVMVAVPWLPTAVRGKLAIGILVLFPFIAYALLNGSWLGMPVATTSDWGGLSLTLVLATVGIIAALPIGIVLALARRSKMPAVRFYAVLWIELFRGTPLITLLFFASVVLPLFFPLDANLDKVVRALVAITIFQSAYTAEAIRGGLAAIPRGQFEAADAMGLGYWKSMIFIILPQALKISIPAIVNSFIQLFKDTSLVLIIGLLDLLNTVQQASRSLEWKGYDTEGYIFAAMVYFVFCFGISRYSRALERRFDTGHSGQKMQQN